MRAPPHASVSLRACHSGVGLPAYFRRNVSSSMLKSSSARALSNACSSSSSACMSASGTYFPPKRPKWPPASGSVEMDGIARESSNEPPRFPRKTALVAGGRYAEFVALGVMHDDPGEVFSLDDLEHSRTEIPQPVDFHIQPFCRDVEVN